MDQNNQKLNKTGGKKCTKHIACDVKRRLK